MAAIGTIVSHAPSVDGEQAYVAAAADGDAAAFGRLYHRYASSVYNLVLRSVRNRQQAEDLCQEIWVRAHQRLGSLRQAGAFSTWLYRIAARACVDTARRRSTAPTTVDLTERLAGPPASDPEVAVIRGEQERLTWESLATLPTRQHLALFLKEVEGKSYREIADVLETSESAVETLLFRARRGFAEAFARLQTARSQRCGEARKVMAAFVDGEATPVRERALNAHLGDCPPCRNDLQQVRHGSVAYAALPLSPLPSMLGQRVFESLGIAGWSGGGGSVLTKLLALAAAKTKLLSALTLTGGLTAATLVSPADQPSVMGTPSPQVMQQQEDPRTVAAEGGAQASSGAEASDTTTQSSSARDAVAAGLLLAVDRLLEGTVLEDVPLPGTLASTVDPVVETATDSAEALIEPLGQGPLAGVREGPDIRPMDVDVEAAVEVEVGAEGSLPQLPTPRLPSTPDLLPLP